MIDFLHHAVAFVVALGLLIVVHEFGHYWVARRLGVKVLRFSVGFGKALWRRRVGRDAMELVIAVLPLGGYVKMLDENEAPVATHELPRAFNRQPVWKRMAIVVAGPLFNFLFAVLAYWAVFVIGVDGIKPVVGRVVEGSIAAEAGFDVGDTILAIDGRTVKSWDQRRIYLFERALDRARVSFQVRDPDGRVVTRTLDLSEFPVEQVNAALLERGIGLFGYVPQPLPVIGAVEPGPAARAGIEPGDRIIAIDGNEVDKWEQLAEIIGRSPGQELRVTVERDGQRHTLGVTPEPVAVGDKEVGRIHIRPQIAPLPDDLRVTVRFGPGEALIEGVRGTWSMSWLTLEMLYRMVKLEVSTRNISGPITIAQYAGISARIGIDQFILFLAVISISLGVLNLLPIPILDGGHLLYYGIEAVKGSPLSERSMVIGQQIGIALLAGLMFLAFYNDLTRLFH